jgi:hypothetical protein
MKMDIKEMVWKGVDWFHMALVDEVMKTQVRKWGRLGLLSS